MAISRYGFCTFGQFSVSGCFVVEQAHCVSRLLLYDDDYFALWFLCFLVDVFFLAVLVLSQLNACRTYCFMIMAVFDFSIATRRVACRAYYSMIMIILRYGFCSFWLFFGFGCFGFEEARILSRLLLYDNGHFVLRVAYFLVAPGLFWLWASATIATLIILR